MPMTVVYSGERKRKDDGPFIHYEIIIIDRLRDN